MTALEIERQGWSTSKDGVTFKQDKETVVFFADIIAVHEPTKKWVEDCVRITESLDEFEMGD